MAFEDVSPAAAIWQGSGLRYILMPQGGNIGKMTGRGVERRAPVNLASSVFNLKSPAGTPCGARNGLCHAAKSVASPSATASQKTVFTPLPFVEWPAVWQEQFQRTKKGLFGWTYWDLGSDLLTAHDKGVLSEARAQAKNERARVMGRLLRELGHPSGTHTFWPPYLELTDEGEPKPELFWSGLKLLGCRGVIIFGSRAARTLIPKPGLRPLQQLRQNGFQVWIMKDLSGLEQDQEHYARMLIFLKETLRVFIRS